MANQKQVNARKSGGEMTLDELTAICGQEFENAKLYQEIADEREASLNAYNSEPYGNEEDGLSKFVTSDVRDVIEWTLPQLVDIFYGSDLPVVFMPENADDVEQAKQESQYAANVLENQNPGFIIIYTWFKDALLQKNGIVKCYWDEKDIEEREEYRDKTLAEFEAIQNDDEFVIEELTIYTGEGSNEKEYDEDEFVELMSVFDDPAALAEIQNNARVHIVGRRKNDVSQIRIENVAPERFFINRDHKTPDPQEANYTCEVYTKTRSEMIEEGYDRDLVMELNANYENIVEFSTENTNRYKKEGAGAAEATDGINDESRDELILFEHYVRVDFDGDGISELRQIITNGPSGEVISNEPVDRNVYHSITPYINPHKFYGRSVADNMMSIQKMKTQIVRNILDSLMYSTIPRKKVKGNVNTADLLSYVPGGVIRMGTDGEVENDLVPFVGADGLSVLQLVDGFRSERTGFSKDTAGLNPAALSDSTNLIGSMIMNQSQLLVKMIASIFANTGMNSLMLHIRELCVKYEKKERIFEVAGKYVSTDPRAWRKRRSSKVKTGIGHSAKMEKIAFLSEILGLQKEIIGQQGGFDGPLTSADGFYNLVMDMGMTSGVKDTMKYFRDPATYQPPEPQETLADAAFKLEKEKAANEQEMKEADKLREQAQFEQKLQWEKQKFEQEQDWEAEKFEREMLYKYGQSARQGIKEFLTSDEVIEEVMTGEDDKPRRSNQKPKDEDDDTVSEGEDASDNDEKGE